MIRTNLSRRPAIRNSLRDSRRVRARVLAGFRALGHGVEPVTARARMHAFYRSSGTAWGCSLS